MRQEGRRVICEERACHCVNGPCGPGKAAGRQPCPVCGGTGRGKRGGAYGCKACSGMRTAPDFERPVECGYCHGTASVPETLCDTLPDAIWQAIPLRVVREERAQTWNEENLALGMVYSCVDYGRAWAAEDGAMIAKIRREGEGGTPQACKVASDPGGVLCDYVRVELTPQGYSLVAVWGGREMRELTADVTVIREGSLFLFRLNTDAAREWVEENVSSEQTWWGSALVVEHRYAADLAAGMQAEGLIVE